MPLHITRTDIVNIKADAIVRLTYAPCPTVQEPWCSPEENMPWRYALHVTCPSAQTETACADCYRAILSLAQKTACETVAIPLLPVSADAESQPQSLQTALDTIGAFLLESDMTVFLVLSEQTKPYLNETLRDEIDTWLAASKCRSASDDPQVPLSYKSLTLGDSILAGRATIEKSASHIGLHEISLELDEGFSEMLLRKIDESGMTDAACYRKANVDRKLFSKIRSNPSYQPSKPTVIAFAFALELSLAETEELLRKAGFALSRSKAFDMIVAYFITHECYNIHELNTALLDYDQSLVGA